MLTFSKIPADGEKKETAELPGDVAAQLTKAIEYILSEQVFLPSGQLKSLAEYPNSEWVYVRRNDNIAIAALLHHVDRDENSRAWPYNEIVSLLNSYLHAKPGERRDEILPELDRAITHVVLDYESRHRAADDAK